MNLMRPKKLSPPYQWAIEGNIKACFDQIDHHALMVRFRRRIADAKVNRLVVAFLKAGVMSEEQFSRTDVGTPQGGILSPLLAVLKEELGLELAEQKTLVTPVTKNLRFLGHHIRVDKGRHGTPTSIAVVPKDRSQRLREMIKKLFRRPTTGGTLHSRIAQLNPRIRGWAYFFRHARGAKHVFRAIDHYIWWTILRWLKKKHRRMSMKQIFARYSWRKPGGKAARWKDGELKVFEVSTIATMPYRLQWERPPEYAQVYGKPGAERKMHAGFGRGRAETTRCKPGRRRAPT